MFVGRIASNVEESYSATLCSSATAIRSLAAKAKQLLLDRHITSHPDFFLASVSERHWKACAVAVTCNNHLVGIVYAKERLYLGCPTGIVYSDTTLETNIVAEAVHREHVLNIALAAFLTSGRTFAMRVVVPRDGFNFQTVSALASSMEMDTVREPVLVGLRAPTGEWLSVAGGWCEHGRATLLFQMNNDQDHHRDSISQVLRSYLIEDLIARGIRDLVFWAGTSAPLVRYAHRIPATAVYLDSRNPGWRLIRILVSSISPHLPNRWREFGHWITPESVPDDGTRKAVIGDD